MKFVKQGFNDPIHDAQNVFRFILNAMSMPSSLHWRDSYPMARARSLA